jgi:hypothetical protein
MVNPGGLTHDAHISSTMGLLPQSREALVLALDALNVFDIDAFLA